MFLNVWNYKVSVETFPSILNFQSEDEGREDLTKWKGDIYD